MRHTDEYGDTFRDITRGIPAGCPLNPLMGPSRWQLRRTIATMHQQLGALGLT
jgi:hypothetical protein